MRFYIYIICCYFIISVKCSFNDYVNQIVSYFNAEEKETDVNFSQNVPYEVSTFDEKFISEASKLNGITPSELDVCQHRVIIKLKKECGSLNDEDIAKLAVHLLNCQSYIEGRKIYPCTEEMTLKSCTKDMDADTWTTYHIMSNRVRAVCYITRQSQFRGIAENTINRLMGAAKHQIDSLDHIISNQKNLQNIIENSQDALSAGHETMMQQQKDLQQAQLHGQLAVERNIQSLIDEKKLIAETHNKLLTLTNAIRTTLEGSGELLRQQNENSVVRHNHLTADLEQIQMNIADVLNKIEDSSNLLAIQNKEFQKYSDSTLKNLIEVNETVHRLVVMVNSTRQVLEEKIVWISKTLGGADVTLDKLYVIVWHLGFVLMAMLCCAFLKVPLIERLVALILPLANLAMALKSSEKQYLGPANLLFSILICTTVHLIVNASYGYYISKKSPIKPPIVTSTYAAIDRNLGYENNDDRSSIGDRSNFDDFDFASPTPPLSRASVRSRSKSRTPSTTVTAKSFCQAKTRVGTPCKLSSLQGSDYCYRHLRGDSVYR